MFRGNQFPQMIRALWTGFIMKQLLSLHRKTCSTTGTTAGKELQKGSTMLNVNALFLSNLFSQFSSALTRYGIFSILIMGNWLLRKVPSNYILIHSHDNLPSVCTTHIQDSLYIQNMKAEIDKMVPALKCT